jgi:hypothetical protein
VPIYSLRFTCRYVILRWLLPSRAAPFWPARWDSPSF